MESAGLATGQLDKDAEHGGTIVVLPTATPLRSLRPRPLEIEEASVRRAAGWNKDTASTKAKPCFRSTAGEHGRLQLRLVVPGELCRLLAAMVET